MEAYTWNTYEDGVRLSACQINDKHVIIPPDFSGKPVRAIGPKVFLSCKQVETVEIPDTVTEIGDWAFAHAVRLRKVHIEQAKREQSGRIKLGRDVFLGCGRLSEITFSHDTYAGNGALRAAAVVVMKEAQLLGERQGAAGERAETLAEDAAFYREWDAALFRFLETPELDGFRPMQAGGEEDYENEQEQARQYAGANRQKKAGLCCLRLVWDKELEQAHRDRIVSYVQSHWDCAWKYVLTCKPEEKAYYKVLRESGCMTAERVGSMLSDMERSGVGAELRAYVLQSPGFCREETDNLWTKLRL